MLPASRIVLVGESPHAHEQEAIDFAIRELPAVEPYTAWGLVELLEPTTGRLYEIDLLVLGYSALYLVEIKSGPGKYEGDNVDWYRTAPDQPARWMDPPLRLANLKAKILKSRLRAKMRRPDRVPRVEALVFLSHPEIDMRLSEEGRTGVVRRSELFKALTRHKFPGAPADWRGERIDQPLAKDITEAMAAIGVRKRKGKMFAGPYELGPLQDDGIVEIDGGPDGPVAPSGYQDRMATHRDTPGLTRRARVYLVPLQTSVERRQLLRRAAEREAQLLYSVRDHENVLTFVDYLSDAPLGPTVLFDAFEDGVPLDAFLRRNPGLSFDERVSLVEQIGRALAYCHRKEVQHGALGPHAVLVRRNGKDLQVKLFNFQLGAGQQVRGTVHRSALSLEPWFLYQAPELREESGRPTPASDVFSLGALAYLIFTGRAPAANVGELDTTLQKHGHLDPRLVANDVLDPVAEAICFATARSVPNRYDDATEWVDMLMESLTRPALVTAQALDPLDARKEEVVGGDLTVVKVLGHGATSRVLEVERASDHRIYALKVSLAPEHDDRLVEEAQLLRQLNHPRIVRVLDQRLIAERTCLLLSHAGEQTLQRYLAVEGSVSLDYASRFGEDLLSALEALEKENILHRDIKPANVGVGSPTKGATHLTLFDLSLGLSRVTELDVGTAVYRDPFLRHRGAWDAAADRWSAAITLHEMLTGIRPQVDEVAISGAKDPSAAPKPILAAERFDAAVRSGLVRFFEQALRPEVDGRFANAAAMLRGWAAAFAAPAAQATKPSSIPPPSAELTAPSEPEVSAEPIRLDAAVESLPLSVGARSALDRAGVLRASDLLGLPDNRLSSVRGVGRKVAYEILALRDRLKQEGAAPPPAPPFFPGGYPGDDLRVTQTALPPAVVSALEDAGLHSLAAVAAAPATHIDAIAARSGFAAGLLSKLLVAEAKRANDREHPPTLEAWVQALLPEKKKGAPHLRCLYGLSAPFLGRIDVTVREVAQHAGVTGPAIYIPLTAARDTWRKHPEIAVLSDLAHAAVADAGGALKLEQAGEALRLRLPHDRSAPEAALMVAGAALFRIVAEVEREQDGGLRLRRIGGRSLWALESEAHGDALEALGKAADELAARPVLASAGEAARRFSEVLLGTALAAVPAERVAELAAQASERAARSTRLEIYPRDLPAKRALELTAAVLGAHVTVDELQKRVSARYPEAAPLPPRPALDALLEPHGLKWSAAVERYERAGESQRTSFPTTGPRPQRYPTAQAGAARAMDADAISARAIDEKIAHAIDRRLLRVVGVTADRAQDAAIQLAARAGTTPVSLDAELLAAMKAVMTEAEVDPDVVHAADREGPTGAAWGNLLALATEAAERVAAKLLPPKKPLILVQPGLLARYRLETFVKALVEAAKLPDAAAIFLLVPAHDLAGLPRINGELVVRGVLPSDGLWLSLHWLDNKHNSAA